LQLTCTVRGGLVTSVRWTRDNALITTGTVFIETEPMIDRLGVSTMYSLSSNISNFVGMFECSVTDGNGRTSNSGPFLINGM